MYARCMVDRAGHLARGHASPGPCVACRSALPGGNRHSHSAALARELPLAGHGDWWAAVRSVLQFAALLQRCDSGPGPASFVTSGVYNTFEPVVRAHERSLTSSLLQCFLFWDALRVP